MRQAFLHVQVVTVNERGPQVELVGKLSKTWMGILHESTTDADHYALNFKPDLDVTTKATLLGISFLIVSHFLHLLIEKSHHLTDDFSYRILCSTTRNLFGRS